jgi:hypothetical protein
MKKKLKEMEEEAARLKALQVGFGLACAFMATDTSKGCACCVHASVCCTSTTHAPRARRAGSCRGFRRRSSRRVS